MTPKQIEDLHRKYATSEKHFRRVYEHCRIVEEIALWCVANKKLNVDKKVLSEACLLHDIGAYPLMNEDGSIDTNYYQLHALLGSTIAWEEGASEAASQAIRTHIQMGLSSDEIQELGRRMPYKNYFPQTLIARLLCYADRFHSKDPVFFTPESYIAKIKDQMPHQVEKFKTAMEAFGVPDVVALAKKYGHSIR